MIYDWFRIFNLDEFLALNLVSRTYELELQDYGIKQFLVVKGEHVSIVHDGHMLVLNLNGKNPVKMGKYVAQVTEENDVYLGILVA